MVSDGTLSSKNLKDVLENVMTSTDSIKSILDNSGVQNITDNSIINDIVNKVILVNKASVDDYKAGHDRAVKYLMGQIMKETKGSVNPKIAMDILLEELNK